MSYYKKFLLVPSVVTFFLFFCTSCTHLFYHPSRVDSGIKEQYKLSLREGYLSSKEGTPIHYWYIPFQENRHLINKKSAKEISQTKGLFLQFHGNAQNMTFHVANMLWVLEYGYDLMVFDYRGYGKSEGEPDPKGLVEDAVSILQYADKLSEKTQHNLITYGQSLGGSILSYALVKSYRPKNLRAVVVESSFYSYREIAQSKLAEHWFSWPFQWLAYLLINDTYSPSRVDLTSLSPTPVYLLYSKKDPVVPYYNADLFYKNLAEPKTLWSYNIPAHIYGMWVEKGRFRDLLMAGLKRPLDDTSFE